MSNIIIPVVFFIIALIPTILAATGVIKTNRGKKIALYVNIALVFSFVLIGSAFAFSQAVSAEGVDNATGALTTTDETAAGVLGGISVGAGLGMIAAAFATGASCIGAGTAVASSAAAAIGAISENPKAFGKAIIFVALAEGVALYGMIISLQILDLLK